MASPLIIRRNGKTQACDPCRRRKVACDHDYPVCGRCRKQPNGASNCHYSSPDQDARSTKSSTSQHSGRRGLWDRRPRETPVQSNRQLGPEDGLWSSPAARAPTGFLGPTSLSAAYLETEKDLTARRHPLPIDPGPSTPMDSSPPSLADIQNMVNLDQGASQLAVRVLQAIPERSSVNLFQHSGPSDEWMKLVSERLIVSTWETYGSYLCDRENVLKLRELGSMICINTRKTFKEDQDDPQAWIESFSGLNLRWEAVGIMFLYKALHEASATHAVSTKLMSQYTEYCSSCITLASMGGSTGSLMLFLMYKRSVLHACMHGETSLPYWKFHAETVAMLTFSGYHNNRSKDLITTPPESNVSTEIRGRVGCEIFVVDKFLSTFVGRPPLLTRRFCSIELPLELDDAALLEDKQTFQTQLHRLHPNGWSMDGQLCSSSLLRVRMMVAMVRDEILEVVLGQDENYTLDYIMRLREKELELYRKLPSHVCSPMFGEIRDIDLQEGYPRLLIRLDHLLNMFLVERLLVKHGCDRSDLLHTSFEMVVLTLNLWTQKNIWVEVREEDQWILMGYATLAGAVLCMELIDPMPVTVAPSAITIAGETYSRSSIIQQLSLLVGYLNSTGPSQPRNSVAHNVRDVIKKVLDHILNNTRGLETFMGSENSDCVIDWDTFMEFNSLDDVNWFTQDQDIAVNSGIQ